MKKVRILLVAIVAVMLVFVSCEKEALDENPNLSDVAFVAGTASVQDGDILLKSEPVAGSRDWYNFYKIAIVDAWSLLGKPNTPFLHESAAENDWVTGANPVNLSLANLLSLTYAPYCYNRMVSVTKAADGTPMYLGIKDFDYPQHNFNITMKGRQLKDYLSVDFKDLQVRGYKFIISGSYDLETIDLAKTMITSSGTDAGWPNYSYVSASAEHKTFSVECLWDGISITPSITADANGDYILFDGYGKEITNLSITYSIEQEIQAAGVPPSGQYSPWKTNVPVDCSASIIGQGVAFEFTTNAVGYEGGNVTLLEDVKIVVIPKVVELN